MSKSALHKFKKNNFLQDEEENYSDIKNKIDKRKQRRFDRAIKTKDLSALVENDEYDEWN